MQSALDAAAGVPSALRGAQPKCDEALEQIIKLLESAKLALESSSSDGSPESVLKDMKLDEKIQEQIKKTLGHTKDIHGAVGKLGKARIHTCSVKP